MVIWLEYRRGIAPVMSPRPSEASCSEREQELVRDCEIANADPDVLALEQAFGLISEDIPEPWTDAPAR